MKKFLGNTRQKLRQYWRSLMQDKDQRKMSRGAENIDKIITSPKGDNWRRRDKKK